ncbi:MAG: sirohydrochlorin cobaltochelatase, partial [Mogibacterium sp.]|nr:sirohydrochlorin cobaltochelatase [Mogibacterium sp.]
MDNKSAQKNGSKALLVVSFGTTSPESRRLNIDAVEQAIAAAAGPGWSIRRCFTSQMIINIIAKKEGVHIDNIREALERAASEGITELAVQPTHLMKGLEYDKLCGVLAEYEDRFEKVSVGDPLLSSEDDLDRAAEALIGTSAGREDGHTAFVFMGHGTSHTAKISYSQMQTQMEKLGYKNVFIGTVEGEPEDTACEAVIE